MSDISILITGGNGMLGRCVTELLHAKGYTNVLTPTSREVDLKDPKAVATLFASTKPEIVLHLAGRVGGIQANQKFQAEFLTDNIIIACNVINQAYTSGVQKLINIGSSCMYPRTCPQPIKEEYLLTDLPEPTNEGYALAKIAAARLCTYLHLQHQCNFYTVIPPNLFGPYDNFDLHSAHVASCLIKKCHDVRGTSEPLLVWGTGTPRREFLYVHDCAAAIVHCMETVHTDNLEYNHINIGTGTQQTITELAEMIRDVISPTTELVFDESMPDGMPHKCMDVSRIHALGWQSTTTLAEGIQHTYDYYVATHT